MSLVIATPEPGRFTFRICVFLFAAICLAYTSARAEERIALVIGNSHYEQLGTLTNAKADAASIADLLKRIGYKTTLVQEASEEGLRKAVRSFAGESGNASIAVVYYAGHGAQVNGENFLLPVDMDIPRQEGDIQLTGLKVDDLVNALHSRVKVVFLDACRDNPALFKNLVRGRGSAPIGLAPANGSSVSPGGQGGGVFIAYATDADSVALDGSGAHSPFAQALLTHLSEPRSLDDMFSIVTREVMKSSNNKQRPYKYASLDEIVCIPAKCGPKESSSATDQNQLVSQSNTDQNETALLLASTDSAQILANADKHPSLDRHNSLQLAAEAILDAEHPEWTLIDISKPEDGSKRLWIRMASIKRYQDRVSIESKNDYASEDAFPNSDTLAPSYVVNVSVLDCGAKDRKYGTVEKTVFNAKDKIVYHHVFGPMEAMTLALDIAPKSDIDLIRDALCDLSRARPLVSRSDLKKMNFPRLATAPDGRSEFYYKKLPRARPNEERALSINAFNEDVTLANILPAFAGASGKIPVHYIVADDRFICGEMSYAYPRIDMYDSAQNLIYLSTPLAKEAITNDTSAVASLRRLMCDQKE